MFVPIGTMLVVCLSVRPSVCDTPHSACAAHLKLTLSLTLRQDVFTFNFSTLTCLFTNFALQGVRLSVPMSVTLDVAVKTTHLTAKVYTMATFKNYVRSYWHHARRLSVRLSALVFLHLFLNVKTSFSRQLCASRRPFLDKFAHPTDLFVFSIMF